jgi:PAS domain S-box-containing protein
MNKATRILVVDDEPAVLQVFSMILRSAGYEVWEASNGLQCLQVTRERRPDLVLLDVMLPDLNGIDICRQIKADAALLDIFVVLVSGKATSTADKLDGAELGADDYIVKPLNPDEFLARIRTIVRLRDTTAALRASEQHYRRLVEILPNAVSMIDLQSRLTTANRQAVEMLGYAGPGELLGKSAFDLMPPEEHERVKADITTTLETGVLRNAEYTMLRKNGSRFPVELSAAVSTDVDGQSRGIVIVARDITARRQAQARIRELVHILDQAHDAIIIRDLEGHVQYFNKGAERILGWTADEVRGRCTTDLFFEDTSTFAKAQEILLQTGEWDGELHVLTKDRQPLIVHSRWTLVHGHHGQSPHVVSISTDITGHKQAEEAFRQSQERYRSLAESSPDAIFILDRESAIQYVNRVAAQWLGKPDTELLGHSQAEFFPPEIARQHQEGIQRAFEAGEMTRTERSEPFRGTEKWIETRLVPLRNQQGKVVHVMGIARDLTEQKRTEEALKEREELSQKIIGTAMEGFWMLDLEENLVDVNEAYCRMSGYSRQELLSMHVSDVEVNEASPELVVQHVQRVIQSGSDRFETRHRRKDGRIIEVEVIATFLKLRERYVFAFMRDITERKRAEEAVRESEERFRQVTESINEVFWMSNPAKNRILYVSPGYEEIWGQTCASLYASPTKWAEAIHPDDRERVLDAARTKQVSGHYNEVYRICRPDGSLRWIQDRAFPVQNKSGNIYRVVGIAEDITQQKEAEEALRNAETRYRSIFENATEGIFRTTPEGRIHIANPALARMFGYQSPEELMSSVTDVGRQIYISTEKRAEMKRLLVEQGSIQGFEEENYRKDGSVIWVSLNAHTVCDADGAVQFFEGTIQDITERKWAERSLQIQRDFGTFLSSSIGLEATAVQLLEITLQNEGIDCGGVFLVDPETGALDLVAHRGFSADFAKRASHFAADSMPARSAGTGRAISRQPDGPLTGIVQQLKRENLLAMEILPIQYSGKVVAVLSVGSHVRGEIPAKSCQAMEAIATRAAGAITRIRAEQSLRANRRLLEKTLHSLRSAVFVVNADTMVIEECNPATTQIFGYTRDELIGRTTASLHADEAMAEQFAGHLHSAVEDKGFLSEFEFKMRRKDGTVFPTEHSMMPIRDEVGRLVSWVSVVQDITGRKRVEEELRQLPWRIIEAQETERLRVARELHDSVNQLIASAKMRLRKVEDGVVSLNPAAREILARCSRLLVQALEENRRIAHNLRPSDLDELGLAAASRNFCKELQSRTKLEVKYNIARIDQRLAPALELNLFRIVQEALTNVEKHAHAREVRLRIAFQGDFIVLKIQDNGRGFDSKRGKAGKGKWRGIGLTNMCERAEFLGGTCTVESAPKQGTTITVRVPWGRAK